MSSDDWAVNLQRYEQADPRPPVHDLWIFVQEILPRCEAESTAEDADSGPCWGVVRIHTPVDDEWYCEGHWTMAEGEGYTPRPG